MTHCIKAIIVCRLWPVKLGAKALNVLVEGWFSHRHQLDPAEDLINVDRSSVNLASDG